MKALKKLMVVAALLLLREECVAAEKHHVVGGDRGWDVASDIASWSSGQIFRVGDKIWFAYSAAHGNIVELNNKEEYEACDVSKFIRKLTDGVDIVALEGEGIRYFASSEEENCKKGLKIHVEVRPQQKPEAVEIIMDGRDSAVAPSTPPSASPPITTISCLTFFVFGLGFLIG